MNADEGSVPAVVRVKEEPQSDDIVMEIESECGASEAAAASLYAEHEVKRELVLGPERTQPQDVAYTIPQSLLGAERCGVKQEPAAAGPGDVPRSDENCGEHLALRTCSVSPKHIRVKNQLHECTICHKTFLGERSLKTHLRNHSQGETTANTMMNKQEIGKSKRKQSYSCESCGKEFPSKTDFTRHVRIHTGEKSFSCKNCRKQFSLKSTLLSHKKYCNKSLPTKKVFIDIAPMEPNCPVKMDLYQPEAGINVVPGIGRLQPDPQAGRASVASRYPSSTLVEASRRPAQIDDAGSEFDSDFDDEFDMEEFAANVGVARDIPDDNELAEHERDVVNSVSRAMDEAVDRLVNIPADFVWRDDFDTFRAVPEEFSGPTPGPIMDYDTPYEAFTSIWCKDFMERIVLETNRYAREVINAKLAAGTIQESSLLHRWTDTNVDEMYLLFAIYIFMGLDARTSQLEYWKTGYLEMPKFRQLMSYNRFVLLNKFIHFADHSNESQNLPQTEGYSAKLAKIAPVLKHLNSRFSKLYNLHQDVVIDESLTLFKGRLSWAQAIRLKAARVSIKSYELCESRTGYLWKFDVYTGNSERGNALIDLANKSTQAVLDLLEGLENRGHLVTMDNFYSCPALVRHLKSLGFDCLGTLRPNRKHVPVEIAKAPNLQRGGIMALHSGDVSCIAWKDTRLVCMISTYHDAGTFVGRKAGRDLIKPVAVGDYNNTMGGVDLKDQKLSVYLSERKRCVKWYVKLFKRLLNASVLNAFVLLSESLRRRGRAPMTHREYREQLANSLAERHRAQETLETSVPQRLCREVLHIPEITPGQKNRGNCHICTLNGKQKKVNLKCAVCDEFLCPGNCWKDWHSLWRLPGT